MKTQFKTYLLSLAAVALLAVPIAAQQGQMLRNRVEQEINRTDEILDRARDAVDQTKSTQAQLAYKMADLLQNGDQGAKEMFRTNQFEQALGRTLKAREKAQAAMSAARTSEQNDDALRARLERTTDLMDQVRESLSETSNNGLKNLYQSTRDNLDRAWEFYRSQQYRAALKLNNQVENTARKLLEAAGRQARLGATYEKRIENVRRVMEQAREMAADCGSETALQLLERAQESFDLAQKLAGEGNREAALQALQTGQELAAQAARECGGQKTLEQRYERLQAQIDKVAERIASGDDAAQTLLEQSRQQLTLARQHLDEGKIQGAVAALKAAQLTLNELRRQLEPGGN